MSNMLGCEQGTSVAPGSQVVSLQQGGLSQVPWASNGTSPLCWGEHRCCRSPQFCLPLAPPPAPLPLSFVVVHWCVRRACWRNGILTHSAWSPNINTACRRNRGTYRPLWWHTNHIHIVYSNLFILYSITFCIQSLYFVVHHSNWQLFILKRDVIDTHIVK